MKIDYNRNALDIFRLIATVQVFLGHMVSHFAMQNALVNAVYFVRGVPILFVLCVFLAAKSLEDCSVKDWLISRAIRIIPGFWACIVINTVLILLVYETKPTIVEGGIYAFTQFFGLNFYTGDWLRGYGSGTPNGVLWTIPVQIQFFLLVPFLEKVLKSGSLHGEGMVILVLAAISVLIQKVGGYLPEIVNKLIEVTVVPYLYFLVAGMVVWYHRETVIPTLRKCKLWILVAYIIWKLMENHLAFTHIFDGVLYNTVTTLLVAALIFAFAFCGCWRRKRDLTYGFYLYHMVFINLLLHFGVTSLVPLWKGTVLTAGIAVATLICAWLSQRFIEAPVIKRLKKRGQSHG